MKKLFVTILFCATATAAYADTLGYMDRDGGQIKLYDTPVAPLLDTPLYAGCTPTDNIVKAWSGDDKPDNWGCWKLSPDNDGTIIVFWPQSKTEKTYRINDFTLTPRWQEWQQIRKTLKQFGM